MIPRIRDVQMKGARSNDKDFKAQKYQRETATHARQKKRPNKTSEEHSTAADEAVITFDTTFQYASMKDQKI